MGVAAISIWRSFLRRLDALLTERAVLEVVGGAAAVLKYGARAPTKDIDTWNRVPKAVQDAADAVAAMGHGVPLAPAAGQARVTGHGSPCVLAQDAFQNL